MCITKFQKKSNLRLSALRGIIKVDGVQKFKAIRHQVMEARVREVCTMKKKQ